MWQPELRGPDLLQHEVLQGPWSVDLLLMRKQELLQPHDLQQEGLQPRQARAQGRRANACGKGGASEPGQSAELDTAELASAGSVVDNSEQPGQSAEHSYPGSGPGPDPGPAAATAEAPGAATAARRIPSRIMDMSTL